MNFHHGSVLSKVYISVSIGIFFLISFSGCYYDKAQLLYPNTSATVDCSLISAKFTADIKPIIAQKCAIAGCHNDVSAAGGSVLMTYAQISSSKDRINVRAVIDQKMPASGPLSIDERSKIKCWINAGAPNN